MFEAFQKTDAREGRGRMATSTGAAIGAYGLLIAAALLFAGRAAVPTLEPKKVDVTFNAPPPPPPPAPPPKPRLEPRPEPKITTLTKADVAPPSSQAPAPTIESPPVAANAPVEAAPQPAATASASTGVGTAGTVGGTGTKAINLPENGEPAVAREGNVAPRMPPEAEANGWEGKVILKGVIEADGTVSHLQVLKVTVKIANQTTTATADHPFAREALAAVSTWRFTPAKVDGVAVPVFRIFPITYVQGVAR
ncbi:MAG TPA: TonB family protein [Myxococcota bacterium]|nr:TonB family protein [Myxococcota bacterium]